MKRLELFYPSRPYKVFQKFDESIACTEDTPTIPLTKRHVISKVNGSCPLGYVELYPLLGMKGHNGEDLYAPRGTPLHASIKGVVEEVQTEPERGLGVGIVSDERYNLGEYGEHYVKARQWHLMALNVKVGDKVDVNTIIGLADSTGLSSGDHNHYEIKAVERYANGNIYNVFQDNGYYGCVPPESYWTGFYAEDAKKVVGILEAIINILKKLLTL